VRYLSTEEVLALHARVVEQSGGATGLRDERALESCLAQPYQTFGGEELYPSLVEKAAALGFFLVSNHPFVDGNKRIGHAALEVTLVLNGLELFATLAEQEQMMLALASGTVSREEFTMWVSQHVRRSA
jgi:death on curing protein